MRKAVVELQAGVGNTCSELGKARAACGFVGVVGEEQHFGFSMFLGFLGMSRVETPQPGWRLGFL